MRIGIAGPVTASMLADLVQDGKAIPDCYSFPYVSQLARSYHQQGHEIAVFATSTAIDSPQSFQGPRCTIDIVPLRPRAFGRSLDRWSDERRALVKVMRERACTVIHAHWTYEFALAAQAGGCPCLITAHDAPWTVVNHHTGLKNKMYRALRALMADKVLRNASQLTVVSPYLGEYYRRRHGYRGTLHLIGNGLPDKNFSQPRPRPAIGAPFTFAAILNGFDRLKNTHVLLRAWEKTHHHLPFACLRLYGTDHGPGEACQRWAIKENLLCTTVEFRGRTPNDRIQADLSCEIDALVHPAVEESFCIAVLEAMSKGLPCIGGKNAGGLPWVMGDGIAGPLIDTSDPLALSNALISTANNPVSSEKWGAAGYQRAHTMFRLDRVTSSYLELLTALAAGNTILNSAHGSSSPSC